MHSDSWAALVCLALCFTFAGAIGAHSSFQSCTTAINFLFNHSSFISANLLSLPCKQLASEWVNAKMKYRKYEVPTFYSVPQSNLLSAVSRPYIIKTKSSSNIIAGQTLRWWQGQIWEETTPETALCAWLLINVSANVEEGGEIQFTAQKLKHLVLFLWIWTWQDPTGIITWSWTICFIIHRN